MEKEANPITVSIADPDAAYGDEDCFTFTGMTMTREEFDRDVPPERRVLLGRGGTNKAFDLTDLAGWLVANGTAPFGTPFGQYALSEEQRNAVLDYVSTKVVGGKTALEENHKPASPVDGDEAMNERMEVDYLDAPTLDFLSEMVMEGDVEGVHHCFLQGLLAKLEKSDVVGLLTVADANKDAPTYRALTEAEEVQNLLTVGDAIGILKLSIRYRQTLSIVFANIQLLNSILERERLLEKLAKRGVSNILASCFDSDSTVNTLGEAGATEEKEEEEGEAEYQDNNEEEEEARQSTVTRNSEERSAMGVDNEDTDLDDTDSDYTTSSDEEDEEDEEEDEEEGEEDKEEMDEDDGYEGGMDDGVNGQDAFALTDPREGEEQILPDVGTLWHEPPIADGTDGMEEMDEENRTALEELLSIIQLPTLYTTSCYATRPPAGYDVAIASCIWSTMGTPVSMEAVRIAADRDRTDLFHYLLSLWPTSDEWEKDELLADRFAEELQELCEHFVSSGMLKPLRLVLRTKHHHLTPLRMDAIVEHSKCVSDLDPMMENVLAVWSAKVKALSARREEFEREAEARKAIHQQSSSTQPQ